MSQVTESIEMDRRNPDQRRQDERRLQDLPVDAERRETTERRKTPRRRQIDPTTCERDYSNDEIEFMTALDQYKRDSGRMFPTCSEILEVIRGLGYLRLDASGQLIQAPLLIGDAGPTDSFEDGDNEQMIV